MNDFVADLEQAQEDTIQKKPAPTFNRPISSTIVPPVSSPLPSTQPNLNSAVQSSHAKDQAYESLRKQIKPKMSYYGALLVRAEDNQVGCAVYVLEEDRWIRNSSVRKDIATAAYVKHYTIDKLTIPAAVFKDLSEGDFMVWIDEKKPISASISQSNTTLADLRSKR